MLLLSTWSCWEEMSDGPCIAEVLQDKTNRETLYLCNWMRRSEGGGATNRPLWDCRYGDRIHGCCVVRQLL